MSSLPKPGPRKRAKKRPSNVASKKRERKARPHGKAENRAAPPTPRGWSLSTLPAVRRRLAAICSDLDRNRFRSALGLNKARTMIYGLSTIAGILKVELELELEREVLARLAALESRMKGV